MKHTAASGLFLICALSTGCGSGATSASGTAHASAGASRDATAAEGTSTGIPPERLCADLNVTTVSALFPNGPLHVTDAHVNNGEVFCRWGGIDTGFSVSSYGQTTDDGYRHYVTTGIGYTDSGTIDGVQDGQIFMHSPDAEGYGKARSGIAFLVDIRGKGLTHSPVEAARKLAQLVNDALVAPAVTLLDLSGCELPPVGTTCTK